MSYANASSSLAGFEKPWAPERVTHKRSSGCWCMKPLKKQTSELCMDTAIPGSNKCDYYFLDWAEARQGSVPAASPFQPSVQRIVGNAMCQELLANVFWKGG